MSNFIISEKQLKSLVINKSGFFPKYKSKLQNEDFTTGTLEVVSALDPTGVSDLVLAFVYFKRDDDLFGWLTLLGAFPFIGAPIVTPLKMALKVNSGLAKRIELSIKAMKNGDPKKAERLLQPLRQKQGFISEFIQKFGGPNGWSEKIIKTINETPDLVVFGPLKTLISDWVKLLGNLGTKSLKVNNLVQKMGPNLKPLELNQIYRVLKNDNLFDPSMLRKPGWFSQTFAGGVPRIFRSPEGRRFRIMMESTKWWLGFLDFIGLANFVGVEETISNMGQENFYNELEKYNKTPEAQELLDQSINQDFGPPPSYNQSLQGSTSLSTSSSGGDPIKSFFSNMFSN